MLFTRKDQGNNMKKWIGLLLSLLILSLSTVTGNALLRNIYPAIISVEGTMTLEAEQPLTFPINTTFMAMVPNVVVPETHNATFHGKALVSGRPIIKFAGVFNVSDHSFWVKFAIEKPEGIEVDYGMYSANGEVDLTIEEIPPEQLEVTWVLMRGLITSYGGEQAFGKIMVHVRIGPMMKQWANVHGTFTQQEPLTASMSESNFSRSFYVFRLVNVSEINYDGKGLYINGLWNVYNVTVTHYDNEFNLNIKSIVENETGDLNVAFNEKAFTLDIEHMEQIDGVIVFYHLMFRRLFERGIPLGDFNGDWKVDIADIARVAKAYGAMLGRPAYDFNLDVNFDFSINIIDVATVAIEFGQEY